MAAPLIGAPLAPRAPMPFHADSSPVAISSRPAVQTHLCTLTILLGHLLELDLHAPQLAYPRCIHAVPPPAVSTSQARTGLAYAQVAIDPLRAKIKSGASLLAWVSCIHTRAIADPTVYSHYSNTIPCPPLPTGNAKCMTLPTVIH